MAKILIVDDDNALLSVLKRYLKAEGYVVLATNDGSEALLMARESHPDIILADAEMPGLDGYSVCRLIKKEEAVKSTPIIIMSGERKSDKDVLSGFDVGVDDYVAKPFVLPVLKARIQAVLKRAQPAGQQNGEILSRAGIELNQESRTASVDGKALSLTRKEFDLLCVLMEKAGRVLSVNYLLETVWGYDPANYNDHRTVEVHISHLRKKLGHKAAKYIVNVLGHGYKFES